jgi:hypothetical protein
MPRTRDDDPYDPTDRGSPAPADPDYPTPPGYHDPVLVGYAPDGTAVYEQQGQLITGGSGNWSPWTGDRASLTDHTEPRGGAAAHADTDAGPDTDAHAWAWWLPDVAVSRHLHAAESAVSDVPADAGLHAAELYAAAGLPDADAGRRPGRSGLRVRAP